MVTYITDAPDAPAPIGPYSQAAEAGGFVFLSGQVPLDPATKALVTGDIETLTNRVLDNLLAVLEHRKLGFGDVIKTTIFLIDLANFQRVNVVYERRMAGARPARSTIQVAGLPLASPIEIEMIAVRRS